MDCLSCEVLLPLNVCYCAFTITPVNLHSQAFLGTLVPVMGILSSFLYMTLPENLVEYICSLQYYIKFDILVLTGMGDALCSLDM